MGYDDNILGVNRGHAVAQQLVVNKTGKVGESGFARAVPVEESCAESKLCIQILPEKPMPIDPWGPRFNPSAEAKAKELVNSVLDAPDRASQMKAFAHFIQEVHSPHTSTAELESTRDELIERMGNKHGDDKRIAAAMLLEVDKALEQRGHDPRPQPDPVPFPPDPMPWPPLPGPKPQPCPAPRPWQED